MTEPTHDPAEELLRLKDQLRFIWWAATTCCQTALGPLDEIRRKLLHEIIDATKGKLPDWFDPNAPEWK